MADRAPSRPALRWHGGKWRLAPWIVRHFPPHRVYVEPFGGAASVLLRKPRAHGEVYNDLDADLVTMFKVLRSPADAAELRRRLELTPFARDEFDAAYDVSDDPLERTRQLMVRSFMGFGSDGVREDLTTGFRNNTKRRGTTPAQNWADFPSAIDALVARLRAVVIENRDAVECMRQHDTAETLHYVDPPYLPETRQIDHRNHGYRHELTPEDHVRLIEALRDLAGMVVLSGYPSPAYDGALAGWRRVERATHADGARPRTEVLWINPQACAQLDQQLPLEVA